ncbi:S-adenosyl-methyltransferase MraW [Obelidium mucronatum]|nr:S-adenosyl-methyltransferase MraW [Obelidium mucronatum]
MAATTVAQQFSHTPVLLKEVLHYISPITALTAYRGSGAAGRRRQLLSSHKDTSAYTFVDATFGGGGYTKAILNTFPGSKLIAIDQDPAAIHEAKLLAEKYEPGRLVPVRGKFGNMSSLLEKELGMTGPCVDGVVFDIGVSSFQIDQGYRGFSWRFDGPLDMRMCADKVHGPRFDELANSSYTAEHIVNTFSEFDLANIIYEYGEERKSRKIARAIVKARTSEPITSTTQLGKIVLKGVGKYSENTHPAMRTFQALRIYINDELNQFKYGLSAAETLLKPSGTLVGVTFHSLEDSILKTFLREASGIQAGPGLRYYKESGKNGYRGIEKYRRRHYKAELPTIAAMEMAFEQDVERLEMNLRDDTLEATSGETCDSTTFKIITRRAVPPGS